jgi:glycosyltransferase involved in cell wall biosynthesis
MIAHPGIGRYIRGLTSRLLAEQDLELLFLGDAKQIKGYLGGAVPVIDFNYPVYTLAEQSGYARLKKAVGGDILHIPHYNIPFFAPFNLVVTIHDLTHILFPRGASSPFAPLYMKSMVRRSLSSAKAVICVSEATRQSLRRFFTFEEAKTHVIYEGVDDGFRKIADGRYLREVRQKYRLPDKFILYVGSIRRHKNIQSLLEVVSCLRRKLSDIQLVIVGKPSQGIGLSREGVLPLPEVETDAELTAIYSLASVFCHLSLFEGFNLTILEAQACGLPVVCSDIAVHQEVAAAGALRVKPDNTEVVVESLYRVLTEQELRARLILAGQANVRRFSWGAAASQTLKLYQGIKR